MRNLDEGVHSRRARTSRDAPVLQRHAQLRRDLAAAACVVLPNGFGVVHVHHVDCGSDGAHSVRQRRIGARRAREQQTCTGLDLGPKCIHEAARAAATRDTSGHPATRLKLVRGAVANRGGLRARRPVPRVVYGALRERFERPRAREHHPVVIVETAPAGNLERQPTRGKKRQRNRFTARGAHGFADGARVLARDDHSGGRRGFGGTVASCIVRCHAAPATGVPENASPDSTRFVAPNESPPHRVSNAAPAEWEASARSQPPATGAPRQARDRQHSGGCRG